VSIVIVSHLSKHMFRVNTIQLPSPKSQENNL
jgi:hypothetical protein